MVTMKETFPRNLSLFFAAGISTFAVIMLKVGIIGLGDIAQKAYLPLISTKNIVLHLCARNDKALQQIGDQYRIQHRHDTISSLIEAGIQAAFVHTSTDSHEQIVEQLLLNDVHVFVDKPITYNYHSTEKLFALAKDRGLKLHVGFNRRVAPAYNDLKSIENASMIVMQKNRKSLPAEVRKFIFDDFIHVIDTILWLFDNEIEKMIVNGRKENNLLYHVVVQFTSSKGATAIAIMNRDSGTIEERLEVFTPDGKRVVTNVTDAFHYHDGNERKFARSDWESTLHKRGFYQLIDKFLHAVENNIHNEKETVEWMTTHQVCEQIVKELE
jgi:virulence factor